MGIREATPPPVEERVIETPTSKLTAWVHPGAGEPIVLLHGGPGVPDYLQPVAELLSPRRTVVRYDQRGSGRSLALDGSYDVEDHLADLDAVRASLGAEQIHLFGHAWGGVLAQLYWAKYPERVQSLLLCNSAMGIGARWKDMEEQLDEYHRGRSGFAGALARSAWSLLSRLPGPLGDTAARNLMSRVWRNYFPARASAPDPGPTWVQGIRARAMNRTRRSILRGTGSMLPEGALRPQMPMIVLFGAENKDIYGTKAELLSAHFPDAKDIRLPGSGHLPWLQDRDEFAKVLREFYP